MQQFYVKPGDSVTFAKTVGESDVYLFAGITGDLAVNHVNEQYMKRSKYGTRIAHGALMIGYASTCSTMLNSTRRLCFASGSRTRAKLRRTASALNGVPSWKRTPGRRWKVQVTP